VNPSRSPHSRQIQHDWIPSRRNVATWILFLGVSLPSLPLQSSDTASPLTGTTAKAEAEPGNGQQRQPDQPAAPTAKSEDSLKSEDSFISKPLFAAPTALSLDASSDAKVRRRRDHDAGITNVVVQSVAARGGALQFAVQERKLAGVLQLFNPFASPRLGTGAGPMVEWQPGQGAAPLPRVFIDDRTHEPQGMLLLGTPKPRF